MQIGSHLPKKFLKESLLLYCKIQINIKKKNQNNFRKREFLLFFHHIYEHNVCSVHVSLMSPQRTKRVCYCSEIVFIYILHISLVKPVHIFLVRNRVSKSFLMAELCFHRFVHFECVILYIYI